MRDLWVEKYRPKTLEGYVFKDDQQRKQITKWIEEKTIPHLLFSGNAGIGKCLGGDELIDVEIDTSTLTKEQIIELNKYIK